MSLDLGAPQVYIQELPNPVRPIMGVSTSITAFIGRALKGPTDKAVTVNNFTEFTQVFGGLWKESSMSYAVYQYFLNGGSRAVIVRVVNGADTTSFTVDTADTPPQQWNFVAAYPGAWYNDLQISIDYETYPSSDATNALFNLKVKDKDGNILETFLNVSASSTSLQYVNHVLDQSSELIRGDSTNGSVSGRPLVITTRGSGGGDGDDIGDAQVNVITPTSIPKPGIRAFEEVDQINMLCIPPYTETSDVSSATYTAAAVLCHDKKRAILIVDPPSGWEKADDPIVGSSSSSSFLSPSENAVVFFPRIKAVDPIDGSIRTFAPCGAIAGVIAKTDSQRGVWKAPAGIEANLSGVTDLTVRLTDPENGDLNKLGINCLRVLPPAGPVVWGSRTWRGADKLADQWKYLPVRRTALYIEESLYRGLQWVVFEPNDEPLWSQIRLNVGSFMHDLFTKGAFQGITPKEAYLVKCDKETTTQYDIDRGIVNILVGFAPLKPAEFVIVKIQQLAGQAAT